MKANHNYSCLDFDINTGNNPFLLTSLTSSKKPILLLPPINRCYSNPSKTQFLGSGFDFNWYSFGGSAPNKFFTK